MRWFVATSAVVLALAGLVYAQLTTANTAQDISVQVVRGGQVGYDPEIGTVQDGIVGDVRAVVSPDRRYVQLNLRPTVSTIVAIDNFVVVTSDVLP